MKHVLLYTFVVLSLFLSGCGTKTPLLEGGVHAEGVLLMKGTPLESAFITFNSESGTGHSAAFTGPGGKFQATTKLPGDGILPGTYIVTVVKTENRTPPMTEQEVEQYTSKHGNPPPVVVEQITDKKYANPKTSGLTITIPPKGDKNIKIELE